MGQGESASEHRVVALLDVEGTLTFRSGLEVNVKLIESLVKKNILDVYLVADSFSLVPQMRRLLEKKYKMEVHGVLSPWDISWAFMNLNEVDNLESLINKPGSSAFFCAFVFNFFAQMATKDRYWARSSRDSLRLSHFATYRARSAAISLKPTLLAQLIRRFFERCKPTWPDR